jgi:hypothetical protein
MNRMIRKSTSLVSSRPFAALLLLATAAIAVSTAAASEPALDSTARIDLSIEPPVPSVALPIALGANEQAAMVEGKASPTTYLLYTFKPPAGRLFELRLFAPEGRVAMSVYRGASTQPEAGAGPKDGTTMWMSSAAEGEELRILVRGQVEGETPFKLGAKLHPVLPGN